MQHAIQLSEHEARRLEAKHSRYQSHRLLSRINAQSGLLSIDAETAGLLNNAATCYEISDGLFDITSEVLRNACEILRHCFCRVLQLFSEWQFGY